MKVVKYSLRWLGVVMSLMLVSAPASAIVVDSAGDSFLVNFNGILDPGGGGVVVQPGLMATATVTLTSITNSGQNWNFSVTLSNNSGAPVTQSRVSVFGFNSNPDVNVGNSSVGGSFTGVGTGAVANGLSAEICFRAGGGGNQCNGGGGAGVEQGMSDNFTFTLAFDAAPTSVDLDGFVVRYQSLVGAQSTSGSGVGTVAPVPLPGAAWLFLTALAGLFARLRLKRRSSELSAGNAEPVPA